MHRGFGRADLDHLLWVGEAAHQLVRKLLVRYTERGGNALASARYGRDKLELLGPCLLEQRGALVGFDDRAQVEQRHRLLVDIDFTHFDQLLDETTETEFLEIDFR